MNFKYQLHFNINKKIEFNVKNILKLQPCISSFLIIDPDPDNTINNFMSQYIRVSNYNEYLNQQLYVKNK